MSDKKKQNEIQPIEFTPKLKYVKSEDYKQYYVTGAIGGFRNPYDFRLSLYNIESNDFLIETMDFGKSEHTDQDEISKKLSKVDFKQTVVCELIMTERAAKELHEFLGKELKQHEKMREKRTGEKIKSE